MTQHSLVQQYLNGNENSQAKSSVDYAGCDSE